MSSKAKHEDETPVTDAELGHNRHTVEAIFSSNETIRLSGVSAKTAAQALINPSAPNAALVRAMSCRNWFFSRD